MIKEVSSRITASIPVRHIINNGALALTCSSYRISYTD